MIKRCFKLPLFVFLLVVAGLGQIPLTTSVQIVKAEDERRWDATLENLIKNPQSKIRERAVLAIGRIGEDAAIPALDKRLLVEKNDQVRAMLMFALGEIESVKGTDAVLRVLQNSQESANVLARAIEAAGKIAAANAKDESAKKLGVAILERLDFENRKRSTPFENVVLLGLTAVLRARPEGGEKITVEFLGYSDPRIIADALNTLSRLRTKSVNEKARELLGKNADPIVRANAARMLGVGEDKDAINLLLNAATKDEDSRVRVSAIRALGSLKEASVAEMLIPDSAHQAVNEICRGADQGKDCYYSKSEYFEIATTLGRLLPNTNNQKAIDFLKTVGKQDNYESSEIEIALAKIAPEKFNPDLTDTNPLAINATLAGIGEIAKAPDSFALQTVKARSLQLLAKYIEQKISANAAIDRTLGDAVSAFVEFKTSDLSIVLRQALNQNDAIVRATVAALLADQPSSKENVEALKTAFDQAFLHDKHDNDAQLAILDALFKLDKKEAVPSLLIALNSPDYLLRKKASGLLRDESFKDSDLVKIALEKFIAEKKNQVLPYSSVFGTRLGQVLNANTDYVRAVSRKNGTVKAVLTTTKGSFTIDLMPEEAPLTVDNFVKLAKSNYFNGVSVHRVVPNFVMQDGDPRGDGNGGPGWSIRCEINTLPFGRGAVGMALSGKDTGGSQWFATHSPQPHLDGGYTVFGRVNDLDMKIVDSIVRGDRILNVKIIEDHLKPKFSGK